jgi:glycosyltransferase involved in cell wall biosynthesis
MFDLTQIKVCFLAGTLGQGGAERQLFYMLKALRERNAQVRLLCLTSGEFWEKKLVAMGIPVKWVGKPRSRLARLSNIVKALTRERADIVQSQHFYVNPYAAAAARLTGSRSIGAIRSDMLSEVHNDNETLRRWGLTFCRIVAANSQPAIRTAMEFGVPRNKLRLLPNVVDTDEFQPDRESSNSTCFTVVSVGRLVPSKRCDRLLAVMARLKQTCSTRTRLLIAGDGTCRGELEQQVRKRDLVGSVEFLGSRTDLPAIYRSAKALAITSDYEGTPNVALEAMACGLPVVSTRVGGVPDIVEHGVNGFLADCGDEEAFAGHLRSLAQDPGLQKRLGSNARMRVEHDCSLERLPKYLEDLYAFVLST